MTTFRFHNRYKNNIFSDITFNIHLLFTLMSGIINLQKVLCFAATIGFSIRAITHIFII